MYYESALRNLQAVSWLLEKADFCNLLGSIKWWIKLGSWKAEKGYRGYMLCSWLDSCRVSHTHKMEFSKPSPSAQLSRWNVWENGFQRKQKQWELLLIPPWVWSTWCFTWCVGKVPCFEPAGPAVAAAAAWPQSPSAADAAVEEQHLWRKEGWHRVTVLPLGPHLTAERGAWLLSAFQYNLTSEIPSPTLSMAFWSYCSSKESLDSECLEFSALLRAL